MKNFIKDILLYAKIKKLEKEEEQEQLEEELNKWSDNYPPEFNDRMAEELGII